MSAPIRIAIRADAGQSLGTGHFARASAVAEALEKGEATEVVLVTNMEGHGLVPAYFRPGTNVIVLPPGCDAPADAMRELANLGRMPDALYLDHYGDVAAWEMQAAKSGLPLLVLDDLDAAREANVIVRPHGGDARNPTRVVLRGPAYLPLSHHVTSRYAQTSRKGGARLRLNVCFGGSDATGETMKTLHALALVSGLDADVVVGPGARGGAALAEQAARLPHVTLHHAPSQAALANLLSHADLALGAGGVMLWERLCLGVPSLVISIAQNQRPQIEAVAATGAIRFLGDHARTDLQTIARTVTTLAADKTARDAMAKAGQELVDGRGASRIAAWLRALALNVRDVRWGDAENLLSWRTHPHNSRHAWATSAQPDFATHARWLEAKLADPDCVFRILSLRDEAVGTVRFDISEADASAYLSIYLVPAWHGRNMGLAVYLAAEQALRASHPAVRRIVSRIHSDNAASMRLHRDAEFEMTESEERAGWLDAKKPIA
jgi:UDP-2,4-diacetamido-2,4,6-trideoxy-beta-L-altropyranose hydrolase